MTHHPSKTTTEVFVHPETKQEVRTQVPVRLRDETARLARLVDRLDPVRTWSVVRVIDGQTVTLPIKAVRASDAARQADAIQSAALEKAARAGKGRR